MIGYLRKLAVAEKMCAMTHAAATQSVPWHTCGGELVLKSWNLEKISDPSEIRAKKISQGRQDLQDHLDKKAFGQRVSRRRRKKYS